MLPPVSFSFQLSVGDSLASFQEVSGITSGTSEEEDLGENPFVHRLPTAVKPENLVLKRGLLSKPSSLADWLSAMQTSDLSRAIEPKTIQVSLMDTENEPLTSWTFHQAYPVRWQISDLNNDSNTMALETLEFAYSYFEINT